MQIAQKTRRIYADLSLLAFSVMTMPMHILAEDDTSSDSGGFSIDGITPPDEDKLKNIQYLNSSDNAVHDTINAANSTAHTLSFIVGLLTGIVVLFLLIVFIRNAVWLAHAGDKPAERELAVHSIFYNLLAIGIVGSLGTIIALLLQMS